MGSEAEWKSLHPGSLAVNLLPRLWRLVRALWPVALAIAFGSAQAGGIAATDLLLLVGFFGLAVASTVVHFLTLRYRVADGRLEVRSGLFHRQTRVISPDRIQNVEMVQNVFHRLTGLVEVRIETASGTEVEGLLSALSVDEAEALIAALGRATHRAPATAGQEPVVAHNGVADLLRYGVTMGRLGAIAVLIGVASDWMQTSDPEQVERVAASLGTAGAAAVVVAAITGGLLFGVGTAVVRHYDFTLTRRGAVLVATEGLLTRRRVELPLGKVQVVSVTEPVLRRALGFGSVHIETAAAREGQSGIASAEAMVPVVSRQDFAWVVGVALPHLDVDLQRLRAQLRPPHPRALLRAVGVAAIRGGLAGAALAWWFGPWGALGFTLVPLGVAAAVLDHRHQGWLVTPEVVVARRGWWRRVTQVVDRRKLQSLQVSQGPFLRNWGLAVLRVRVAGSAVVLPVLSWDDAVAIQDDLAALPPARDTAA